MSFPNKSEHEFRFLGMHPLPDKQAILTWTFKALGSGPGKSMGDSLWTSALAPHEEELGPDALVPLLGLDIYRLLQSAVPNVLTWCAFVF